MKKFLLPFLLFFSISFSSFSQVFGEADGVNYQGVWLDLSPIQRDLERQRQFYTEDQWKVLMQKKYLTPSYSPCYVDDFKTLGYMKYNMADDQMEFLKDDETYYLKKEAGRTVRFTTLNSTYKVFEYDGRLDYFLVQKEGKSTLLVKQVMKYIKPQEPKTSYDEYKPADFKRSSDEYFIAFNNKDLVKIPRNKKKFYSLFGDKESDIKSYMNKQKLGYKDLGDIEKIVTYFNTL